MHQWCCSDILIIIKLLLIKNNTGYSQLNEFTASIDIPCMSNVSYIKTVVNLTKYIHETSWDQMRLAG